MSWSDKFSTWAQAPSESEQEKCENAERIIRKAIEASPALRNRNVVVFPQGSYRNRTNVRQDSDVDICVMCRDSIFFDLPDGMTAADFGITTPAPYPYAEFKNDVGAALTSYLGRAAVTRGGKAFDVHENSYRVDADVIACFEMRRYRRDRTYNEGTSFVPDSGSRIENWPQQHYDNGVAKNETTKRAFKAGVRILKNLRNEMADAGVAEAQPIPSYLMECLMWNVPNEGFTHDIYGADLRYAFILLFNSTKTDEACREWGEINGMKYLFRAVQPWTREQANRFIVAAWNHVGFK
jgi:hypothetical protein